MNWFILSLIAMLFWSGSDLFSKIGSRPNDKYSHWKMVIVVGVVMGIHALYMIFVKGVEFDIASIITYLPASILYILSMIFGYAGLRYIELSVSSPVCNSSGAVAVILFFVFLGERVTLLQGIAVFIVCLSVFLLSYIEKKKDDVIREKSEIKYQKSVLAIIFPLLYCLIDGLGTFVDGLLLDKYIKAEQANIAYEFTFLIIAIFAFIYVTVIKKEKIQVLKEKSKIAAALSETAGQFAYIFAIEANAILAAPIISSYCILSLVWSRIVLKEKLLAKQYIVIFMAAIGIAILGME
ncbi:EamA family transporter [uncultured Tyzzerella sp.]|uniref:EamA family transporter n=1 Tax=uncultured Tyzzerella sp. TaxID=2321398 RepID=UPI002943EB61|nr:EamA family transporter [uncultured Tyzzerella sp.]